MPLTDLVALSSKRCSVPIVVKLKYATAKNFVGRPIPGYDPNVLNLGLMTPKAAEALCEVQNYLIEKFNLGLKVFDAYRPKRAVLFFKEWSTKEPDEIDNERKKIHYPDVEKNQFFDLGYVAEDSGHCYGNTVDLVLIDLKTGKKVPMGSRYDFMGKESWSKTQADVIGQEAFLNRQILADAMKKFGFNDLEEEYWHYSHGGKEGRELTEPQDVEITEALRESGVSIKTSM